MKMVKCAVCDAPLDHDEDDLDEGDEFTCDECGADLVVASKDPLEVVPASDKDEEEEDEDEEDLDEDEEDEDEDEDEEDDEWK
jgi:alpha-aminoadipate/glutamate carrier protein LysW